MSQHHQIIITLRQRERGIAEILVVQFLIDVLHLLPVFIIDVETQVITHITQLTTCRGTKTSGLNLTYMKKHVIPFPTL